MKKALLYGPFDLRVEEVPEPEPGPGEVRIRVVCSGPYGTDLKYYRGEIPVAAWPVGFGGESAGIIDKLGAGVTERFVGQRVTPLYHPHCGYCKFCLTGRTNLCINFPNLAAEKKNLACFNEYMIATVRRALPLPECADFETGSQMGSCCCAVAVRNKLLYKTGETVLVIGGGPTGIPNVQLAKAAGCRVIVFEHREVRRRLSLQCGAEQAVDPRAIDVPAFLKEVCGTGPECVIETSGSASSTRAAVDYAGWGARVALMGSGLYDFSAFQVMHKGLAVHGIRAMAEWERQEAINLLGSVFQLKQVVTHRFPFVEIKKAFELLHSGSADQGRVILDHSAP